MGGGVAVNWLWKARQDAKAGVIKVSEDRDAYRLKEREQLAIEVAATIERQRQEIDRERAESLRLRKVIDQTCESRDEFKEAFENVLEDWKNSRHVLIGINSTLYLQWQAGKPAPEMWPEYPKVPNADTYLKKSDGG